MPIGAQNLGTATGPDIGPRIVDPRAATTQGITVPTGIGATPVPAGAWIGRMWAAAEVLGFAQIHVGPCTLYGWSLVGPPGQAPGFGALYDGRTVDDPLIAGFNLGLSTFATDKGIAVHNGLYLVWLGTYAPAGALYFQ
jgi:hypothetical protein